MTIDEQIAVMQAFRDGAEIEYCRNDLWFHMEPDMQFNFYYEYRIAPKKEMSLVEILRTVDLSWTDFGDLCTKAADRIEELESSGLLVALQERIAELEKMVQGEFRNVTTDELLAEIARRIGK